MCKRSYIYKYMYMYLYMYVKAFLRPNLVILSPFHAPTPLPFHCTVWDMFSPPVGFPVSRSAMCCSSCWAVDSAELSPARDLISSSRLIRGGAGERCAKEASDRSG